MKRIFPVLIALSVIFSSCSIIAAADAEAKKEAEELAQKALETGDIRVDVTSVISQYGPSVQTTGEYWLQIKDGKASSYLPFFGTSTYAAVGSANGGISIDNCPVEIQALKSRKSKGETKWFFVAKTERENVEVTLTFWNNGSASIHCSSNSRSAMNYNGNLEQLK